MTPRISNLDARIASLEERIQNMEYVGERLVDLVANAGPTQRSQYERALAAHRATVALLTRKLEDERPKLARYAVIASRSAVTMC